jgi:polyisoprenyl-teichoic acid--peptidoglycan teichoic acid transferase
MPMDLSETFDDRTPRRAEHGGIRGGAGARGASIRGGGSLRGDGPLRGGATGNAELTRATAAVPPTSAPALPPSPPPPPPGQTSATLPAASPPRRGASPAVAALLSLVFPGLGQLFAGAFRRGLLVALPTLLLVIVIGASLGGGMKALLAWLVQPAVLYGIVILNGIFAVYHLFAIADAFWTARRRRARPAGRRATVILTIALVAAVGLHGLVGGLGVQAYQMVSTVFVSPGTGYGIPEPSFSPDPGEAGTTSPTPTPGPAWAADGRLNLLLIGGDSGPGRTLLRTDTMMLLSVDSTTGRAALFGIPRNLVNVPVAPEDAANFPNGRFPQLLNALYVYAYEHAGAFPDGNCKPRDSDECGKTRGFRAITGAIQQLTGVPLDGAVIVNLNGFVDLVDAVAPHGLWIRTVHVYDSRYPLENGQGYVTIDIPAGCQQLDGHVALEYARSRHQDSDYGRMKRQQQVLLALLRQIDPIAVLPQVSHLLDIAKTNLTLAIPTADIGSLAALAARVDPDTVERLSLDPPDLAEYLTTKEIARVHALVRTVFDGPVAAATPSPSVAPTNAPTTSHAPKPTATPSPCGPA